ncbi:hypothetical protein [Planctomyces sp. SH-PL62]|uniref:hypothetical protein n=1 Tax=Planctomyces sp. SH-PL62 TaxID=1636152 RepID=UPI00078B398C|nr:hypothetical protein [Planctomyces sp. SH-PL62]AMV41047.1 hypothetical protein VT85_26665 [Planctomyces sp. SH-PL62]
MRIRDDGIGFDEDADCQDFDVPGVACVPGPFDLPNVPAELRALEQWILWTDVDGRKLPRTADGRRNASTTDPATWTTFEAAAEALREAAPGRFSGLGFVFTGGDPYVGIDLDGCLDGGEIADWAKAWLDRFKGCYAEVSPSGNGVKVWARGKLPGGGCRRKADEGGHTASRSTAKGGTSP